MAKKKPHQSKSKTKKPSRSKKSKITSVDKKVIAKRRDAINRDYFINTKSGKRVSKKDWSAEKKKIDRQRSQRYADQLSAASESESTRPFPDKVSSQGIPESKITFDQSEFEGETFEVDGFEPYPIEGEDETG